MKLSVRTRLPDLRLMHASQRDHLRCAGVTMGQLRTAWQVALASTLTSVYSDDQFDVVVVNDDAEQRIEFRPVFNTWEEKAAGFTMTKQLAMTVEVAGAAWLSSLGTFSCCIAHHRETVYT